MRTSAPRSTALRVLVLAIGAAGLAESTAAQEAGSDSLPTYLRDRGTGVVASIPATYIRRGELLVYPFFEYSIDNNREYQPDQFGVGPDQDFRARYRAYAGQLFLGYGITDWLAVEFEAAYLKATFEKSPSDPFPTPARLEESGFGDIEAQIRARLLTENERRPEIFSFAEITARSQRRKVLIGDPDWDFRPGVGLTKGFSWGTLTARATGEWNHTEKHPDFGEVALDYLKRISPALRVNLGVEGGEGGSLDEWDLTTGVQWRLKKHVYLKLNNAFGLSSKSTDWAPFVGVLFVFPTASSK